MNRQVINSSIVGALVTIVSFGNAAEIPSLLEVEVDYQGYGLTLYSYPLLQRLTWTEINVGDQGLEALELARLIEEVSVQSDYKGKGLRCGLRGISGTRLLKIEADFQGSFVQLLNHVAALNGVKWFVDGDQVLLGSVEAWADFDAQAAVVGIRRELETGGDVIPVSDDMRTVLKLALASVEAKESRKSQALKEWGFETSRENPSEILLWKDGKDFRFYYLVPSDLAQRIAEGLDWTFMMSCKVEKWKFLP